MKKYKEKIVKFLGYTTGIVASIVAITLMVAIPLTAIALGIKILISGAGVVIRMLGISFAIAVIVVCCALLKEFFHKYRFRR